jgi:hypothetical protein
MAPISEGFTEYQTMAINEIKEQALKAELNQSRAVNETLNNDLKEARSKMALLE